MAGSGAASSARWRALDTRHAGDERHVHRLAYLQSVGEVGVQRVALPRPPGARSATWTALLALGLLLVTIGAGAWRATRPLAPVHGELAPSADAWTRGGRPLPGTDAARAVFAEALPRYVVALDRERSARGDASTAALDEAADHLRSTAAAALGPDTASFLSALIDQSRDILARRGEAAVDSHLRSLDALNRPIADLALGYDVDAEVLRERRTGQHRVYRSSFTVERVRYTGAARRRSVRSSFGGSIPSPGRPMIAE